MIARVFLAVCNDCDVVDPTLIDSDHYELGVKMTRRGWLTKGSEHWCPECRHNLGMVTAPWESR